LSQFDAYHNIKLTIQYYRDTTKHMVKMLKTGLLIKMLHLVLHWGRN